MAHAPAVGLPNLSRIFQQATEQTSRDLALSQAQGAVQRRNRIEEVLSGVDLQNREDVIGGLQSVAPIEALDFAQKSRGQPAEDLEFGVFMAGRLANVFEQVEDQESFDDAKKFAMSIGFPEDKVALAGDTYDPDRVAQVIEALRAVSPETIEQSFEEPAELPGAAAGAGLFQKEVPSGRVLPVTGTGVTAGKVKDKFGPLEQLKGAPEGTLAQENLTTNEIKVKVKPTVKKGVGKRGATTAEFNAIASRISTLFGGLYNPTTQRFAFQSKDIAIVALRVTADAERLFADNEELTPTEAAEDAFDAFQAKAKVRRRTIRTPGGKLEDIQPQ